MDDLIKQLKTTHAWWRGDQAWLDRWLDLEAPQASELNFKGWTLAPDLKGAYEKAPLFKKESSLLAGLAQLSGLHYAVTLKESGEFELPAASPFVTFHILVESGLHLTLKNPHGSSFSLVLQDDVQIKILSQTHTGPLFTFKEITTGRNCQVDFFEQAFGTDLWSELLVKASGAGSKIHSQLLFLGRESQQQKWIANHLHLAPHTHSEMSLRGAVKDESRASVYGNILMVQGTDGADGNLAEHNLILSSKARIEAVPALEVAHHNVNASHSASIERVNEEQLFYLESRGLPERESMELILEGFFWDSLQKMGEEDYAQAEFTRLLKTL